MKVFSKAFIFLETSKSSDNISTQNFLLGDLFYKRRILEKDDATKIRVLDKANAKAEKQSLFCSTIKDKTDQEPVHYELNVWWYHHMQRREVARQSAGIQYHWMLVAFFWKQKFVNCRHMRGSRTQPWVVSQAKRAFLNTKTKALIQYIIPLWAATTR